MTEHLDRCCFYWGAQRGPEPEAITQLSDLPPDIRAWTERAHCRAGYSVVELQSAKRFESGWWEVNTIARKAPTDPAEDDNCYL